jgi:glycosyltransferase involved in cell wall biosynthesis
MKLLIILPYVPYPLDSGGNQAVFTMVEAMSHEHNLTIVLRGKETDDIRALKKLLPLVTFKLYPYANNNDNNPYDSFGFNNCHFRLIRYFASSFRRKYHRYLYRHADADFLSPHNGRRHAFFMKPIDGFNADRAFFQAIGALAKEGFDAVQCEFYDTLPLAYYLPDDILKIFVHHEMAFVRMENELALFEDRTIEDEVFFKRLKDKEISMLKRFNHIVVLTEHDKAILDKELPASVQVHASPAIVRQSEDRAFSTCANELVFVGNASHYPNLDGMTWFCQEVLPELRKHGKNFKIYVTGQWSKKIQKQLFKLASELEFVGFVPDLNQFLNGKISICPIRIGSGMRMKVLESVQAMSPIVITQKGIEGQDFNTHQECMIADSAKDFADAIVKLSEDLTLQESISKNAKEKIKSRYNPNEMIEKRLAVYRNIGSKQL